MNGINEMTNILSTFKSNIWAANLKQKSRLLQVSQIYDPWEINSRQTFYGVLNQAKEGI